MFCGKPVNPYDASTWKEVAGFVGGPRKDSMRLRQDTGRFAHNHCVQLKAQGQEPGTASLMDEVEPGLDKSDDDIESLLDD